MVGNEAMFVKLENYNDLVDVVNTMKTKLDQAKSTLAKLKDIKKKEETEIELWERSITEIETKLHTIETTLLRK